MNQDEGEFDWSQAKVSQAKVMIPRPKQVVSVSIDSDVLDFFKAQGRGCQTRITRLLMPEFLLTEALGNAPFDIDGATVSLLAGRFRVSLSAMQFRLGYLFA